MRAKENFLETPSISDFEATAMNLARCESELTPEEFRSQCTKLLARFFYDNPGQDLSNNPKLNFLTGKLTPNEKETLALFYKFKSTPNLQNETAEHLLTRAEECVSYNHMTDDIRNNKGIAGFKQITEDTMTIMKKDKNNFKHYLSNQIDNNDKVKEFTQILLTIENFAEKESQNSEDKDALISGALQGSGISLENFNGAIEKLQGNRKTTIKDGNTVLNNPLESGDNLSKFEPLLASQDEFSTIAKGGLQTTINQLFGSGATGGGEVKVSLNGLDFDGTGVTDLKSKDKSIPIRTVRSEMAASKQDLEALFNERFAPTYGNVSLDQVLEIFQKSPEEGGVDQEKFLATLDDNSKQIFLKDILYPAATMDIQLKALKDYDGDQTIGDAQSSLKFVGAPALGEQLTEFQPATIQKLISLSYHGLDPEYGNRPPSLIGKTQLDALQKMEKSYTGGKPQAVKLGAGEGKTFLSTIFSELFDLGAKGNPPVIHIAPFAEDEKGWDPLPRTGGRVDFSKMKAGQHYWVRADQMATAVDSLTLDSAEPLQGAMLFCDEYDRYPQLNSKMDGLGCFKRCNMSATDNLSEVNVKIGEKARSFEAIKSMNLGLNPKRLTDLSSMTNDPDSFDPSTFKTETDQLIAEIDAQPGANSNEKLQYVRQKIVKLQTQIPVLIARRVDQMDTEFNGRGMSIQTSETDCKQTLLNMSDQCAKGGGKSSLLCFQGAEFVVDGGQSETGREAIDISTLQSTLQGLYTDGEPVYVHMSAPKGMSGFNEGHPITMIYDGSGWNTVDFNQFESREDVDNNGSHVCLYDTFNKVGGDFKRFSNEAHYQACQVDNSQDGEPTTKSLLYQMARRNRTGKLEGGRKRCDLNVFMSDTDQQNAAVSSPSDKDTLLKSLSDKESEFNQTGIQERNYQKRGNKMQKLFDKTVEDWKSELKQNGASDELLMILDQKVESYKKQKGIGLKLKTAKPVSDLENWNNDLQQVFKDASAKLLLPDVQAAGIAPSDWNDAPDFDIETFEYASEAIIRDFGQNKLNGKKGALNQEFKNFVFQENQELTSDGKAMLANHGINNPAEQKIAAQIILKSLGNTKPSAGTWKSQFFTAGDQRDLVPKTKRNLSTNVASLKESQQKQVDSPKISINESSYEYIKAQQVRAIST